MTENVYGSQHDLILRLRDQRLSLTLQWPRGCGCHPAPTDFSSFPQEWEWLFCKLNF